MNGRNLNAKVLAVSSIALFIVGLLGFFLFDFGLSWSMFACCFLLVTELLALIFGIMGWSETLGKVGVIGVCVLVLWSVGVSIFLIRARETSQDRMNEMHQELLKKRIMTNSAEQLAAPLKSEGVSSD
jgi:uncharacterized membrane protein